MEAVRDTFDWFYDSIKHGVFWATQKNPELAHTIFSGFCKGLYYCGLDKLVLDFEGSRDVEISNAAGFNKNGDFPLRVLGYLGFSRSVVGTVSADAWEGNPKPRIVRYPETKSMVNWMGLPGVGCYIVRENLEKQEEKIPLTINIMGTPGKESKERIKDLERSIVTLRDLDYVDRFELNVSCPNTKGSSGDFDAREEYRRELPNLLEVRGLIRIDQEFYVKVSPDIDEEEVDELVRLGKEFDVDGYTLTNTTTHHDIRFIPNSPRKGGASGDAVYERARAVQKMFYKKKKDSGLNFKIIACGGINSLERLQERRELGAEEFQIYTPLIFEGFKLLRELRN